MKRDSVVFVACTILVLLFTVSLAEIPKDIKFTEIKNWDIVLSPKAIPSEKFAAEEFRDIIEKAGGFKLPIVTKISRPNRHIFIGYGQQMVKSNIGFSVKDMGKEDLRIVFRDGNIAIAGGRPRGTLYGVYTFLEDYLGVRFLTGDHTHIPPLGDKVIPELADRTFSPRFELRWSSYGEVNRLDAPNPLLGARLRCNIGHSMPKYGGVSDLSIVGHSFWHQIPTKKYGQKHPEYFALHKGKRLSKVENEHWQTQPCLTHPNVFKIVMQAVMDEIKKYPNRRIICVSQNDNTKYCKCPQCQAINTKEGSPMGTQLMFVNKIADEVAKVVPNVYIGTLAYQHTRKLPKTIRPRKNVIIQLCSLECSILQPMNDPKCKLNAEFIKDIDDWTNVCDKVLLWSYNTNFRNYLLPCPNLRIIEPNIKFFASKEGIKGVRMQGASWSRGAEFAELRNYVTSRLLWDPSQSGQALIEEFINLHYGKAAPPILRFINLIHDNAESKGITRNCYGTAMDFGINKTIVKEGLRDFDEAIALAGNELLLRQRVEKASICVYRAAIEEAWLWVVNHQPQIKNGTEALPAPVVRETLPYARKLFKLCDKYGVTDWREGFELQKARDLLNKAYRLSGDQKL